MMLDENESSAYREPGCVCVLGAYRMQALNGHGGRAAILPGKAYRNCGPLAV